MVVTDEGGQTLSLTGTATVTTITAGSSAELTATEGVSFSGTVGTIGLTRRVRRSPTE